MSERLRSQFANARRSSRREFVRGAAGAAASTAIAPFLRFGRSRSDEIRFAIIGLRTQGHTLRRALTLVDGARLVALCDVDAEILGAEKADAEKGGAKVEAVKDLRRVLDRKDVEAVMIAAPNHWHALATIWACQAGKDVYVEKPVSHSVWEGQRMLEAARKYDRIVQAGTQDRSDSGLNGFAKWEGKRELGRALWAHAVWFRVREPIGKIGEPPPVPPSVDYDLFCGPRAVTPLRRKSFHYDWHWQWPTGNGEVGNLGAHLVDDARWLLGLGLPRRAMQAGARLVWNDDGETPNVSLCVFDFGALPVVLELRNLPLTPGGTVGPSLRGRGSGVLLRFERGWAFSTRADTTAYGDDGRELQRWRGDAGKEHIKNFAAAVRSHDRSLLHAEIEDATRSAATCHFANLSWRTGRAASLDEIRDAVGNVDPAHSVLDALPAHLAAHGVDLGATPMQLGGWLTIDSGTQRCTAGPEFEAANALLRDDYREPFVVPEKV